MSTKQISGLYWNPDEKHFIGLENYKEKGMHRFRHVQLDNDWVKQNFDGEFLNLVVVQAVTESKRFVKLPIGKGRSLQKLQGILKNPGIAYPQYGLDTCIFSSLCSALHYLQLEDIALQVDDLKFKILKEEKTNFIKMRWA